MVKLQRFHEDKALVREFGKYILEKQDSALAGGSDAVFNIAISGGSMNKVLYEGLVNNKDTFPHIKWPQWRIFFCDERLVPFEDPLSNYGQFKKTVLDPLVHKGDHLNLGPTVYTINQSLIGGGETANKKIAEEYASSLPGVFRRSPTGMRRRRTHLLFVPRRSIQLPRGGNDAQGCLVPQFAQAAQGQDHYHPARDRRRKARLLPRHGELQEGHHA